MNSHGIEKRFVSYPWLLTAMLLLAVPLMAGCQGCRNEAADADGKGSEPEEEKEPKKPFKFDKLAALPDLEDPANQAKPGHWVAGHRQITANDADFQGMLEGRVIDGSGRPIRTELTDHFVTTERPLSLPKGTTKDIEVMFYIPRRLDRENVIVTLEQQLYDRRGRRIEIPNGAVNLMKEYRFFFIVLSTAPSRYSYVKTLPTTNISGDVGRTELFRVVTPTIKQYVPLPSESAAWTSFAFLLWDDLDPAQLEPAQQQALLDWLHFGGQLIISGPDSLNRLANSFLGPYLPATSDGAAEFTGDDVASFSKAWTIPSKHAELESWQVTDQTPVIGERLSLTSRGDWVPLCDSMVAEGSVGRGRIVVSAFSLSHRSLLAWPSFDSFFHNALLRRPSRRFKADSEGLTSDVPFEFVQFEGKELDARYSTTLRYVTRDLASSASDTEDKESRAESNDNSTGKKDSESDVDASVAPSDYWHLGGFGTQTLSGVAGWSDDSPVADVARKVLDSSAGIAPPSAKFVLGALVGYLVVLVPLNWLVFRVIGRVEWAWIAAPVLSIAAAVGIVRMARLDIGFARSHTELNIVELQQDYGRAHVTRYSTLYSSLTTDFSVDFASDGARGQPWGSPMERRDVTRTTTKEVKLSQAGGIKLKDVVVASNSAELLHLEQTIDVGGPIRLSTDENSIDSIVNSSQFSLQDVGVLGREADGSYRGAWIGELKSGTQQQLTWSNRDERGLLFEQWQANPITSSGKLRVDQWMKQLDKNRDQFVSRKELKEHPNYEPKWYRWFLEIDAAKRGQKKKEDGRLSRYELTQFLERVPNEDLWLGSLLDLMTEQLVTRQDGAVLFGWCDEPLAGAKLRPRPSQARERTLVLVHLKTPKWGSITPDANLYRDAITLDDDDPIPGVYTDGAQADSPETPVEQVQPSTNQGN